MYNVHPEFAAMLARIQHEEMRRAAGDARTRRAIKRQTEHRFRRRRAQ
jgi:hypothetical protein